MKYRNRGGDEVFVLSRAQEKEILECDKACEEGEMETYPIDEVIRHFKIIEK